MKAIVFDVDDTLYDLAWPFQCAVHEVFDGVYDGQVEQVFLRSRVRSDELFEAFCEGRVSEKEYYVFRNQMAFKDCGIMISDADAIAVQDAYKEYQKQIRMSDPVKEMLGKLKSADVITGIITNGKSELQRKKIRTLDILSFIPEEHIIVSEDTGFAKPQREIFDCARKKFGIEQEDAWYIGDTFANDVEGPIHAGWHAVWFNHRHQKQPEGTVQADITVETEAQMIQCVLNIASV